MFQIQKAVLVQNYNTDSSLPFSPNKRHLSFARKKPNDTVDCSTGVPFTCHKPNNVLHGDMQNGRVRTGLIKFRIITSGDLMRIQQLSIGFHTMPRIPSLADELLPFQTQFCSKQLVTWFLCSLKIKTSQVVALLYVFSTELPNAIFHLQDCLYRWHVNNLYYTCTYNCLPEDDTSGSKHVENIIKTKILVLKWCILLVYIM
jgi:hypothetical protein